MIGLAIAVLVGIGWVHIWPILPQWPWHWGVGLTLALLLLSRWRHLPRLLTLLVGLGFGVSLAALHGQSWLAHAVPESLTGSEVAVQGVVASIPQHDAQRSRFVLHIHTTLEAPAGFQARRLRVTAFPAVPELQAGQSIELRLRLRPPRGLHNPGTFNYANWLYRLRLHGTASVRGPLRILEDDSNHPGFARLHRWREHLRNRLLIAYPEAQYTGIMQALIIGERAAMTPEQWRLFLHSGTNHLIAISGLHVGLVSGFVFMLMRYLWYWVPPLHPWIARTTLATLAAMLAAAAYAALAGFSVPTQRALIMLVLGSLAFLARRNPISWHVYSLALLLVLILHPPNVLAPGFWFSFAAVAAILLAVQGQVQRPGWMDWLRIQWILAILLLPLGIAWFQLGTWIAPVANLVAVPIVTLLILPALLLAAGLAWIYPPLAWPLLWWADTLLGLLLTLLDSLVHLPGAVSEFAVPLPAIALVTAALFLLFLPRWLSIAPWLIVISALLWLTPAPRLAEGEFRAELLDVGHGLAVLVQTRQHVLVYDAGPAWPGGLDTGASVVVPRLRQRGVRQIDHLVVSHEHQDHRGGVAAITAAVPITRIYSRRGHPQGPEYPCERGLTWQWDGVTFRVLHPPAFWDQGNAASCVLHIASQYGPSLLLTGDIEGLGETVLVRNKAHALDSDLLLVPHHGARATLSRGLLEAVNPQWAWVSSGFGNRFGHPVPEIRARLADHCIPLYDTAERGWLWAKARQDGWQLGSGSRLEQRRFWQPVHLRPQARECLDLSFRR